MLYDVITACEYSGIVRNAFTDLGYNAISVDILNSESHGNHYKGDIFEFLKYNSCTLLIGFPPCTYLAKSQFHLKNSPDRMDKSLLAFYFFMNLFNLPIPYICLENPVGYVNTWFRKPNQIISPNQFGSVYQKEICLWFKNLPPLILGVRNLSKKSISNHVNSKMSQALKSHKKSKFFPEVAQAMALQWSYLL